jgi:hypothetical protein
MPSSRTAILSRLGFIDPAKQEVVLTARSVFAAGVLALVAAGPVAAQDLAPGTRYNAAIPTFRQVLGYDVGAEITTPDGIVTYLKALNAAAPDRTRLVEYARTWEGRPLYVLIVGSPERMAHVDELQRDLQRLADPRTLAAGDAEQLMSRLPVVVWLMHAVHGNEISSCDAALFEAYHLLAAEGDATVDTIRREAVVLIDPLQNPDGRARFLAQNLLGRAASPDPDRQSAEHDEPWPGGRSNHYLFDMNRDWFASSQPETQGRLKLGLQWLPQVVVDLHEMGGDSTYYFAPPADPLNPYITKAQAGWLEAFGRANAATFDARGFAYFIREVYDSFYPGYGESWPIYHGAVGMTFEMASARGLIFRREDETLLTYRDGIVEHFTAALTTMATAATNRAKLLRDFLDYRRSAIADGERIAPREYVLIPGTDRSKAERLAAQLVTEGVEVRRAAEAVTVAPNRTVPAGAFLVSAAQPAGRLVRNLLEPNVPQPEAFVKEQDRRRKRRMSDQIYDVTGWNMPLLFDVEVATLDRPATVRTTPVTGPPAPKPWAPAKVGYLVPWGFDAASLVAEALQRGVVVRQASEPFTLGGRRYAGGTAIIRVSDNDTGALQRVQELAARYPSVDIVPIDTGWVDDGISLGSGEVVRLKSPRVLLAWDEPTFSSSAGWTRFVLERRFHQPASAVRVSRLSRVDLAKFDVVVLPSGDYADTLGDAQVRRLREWVRGGGTLVTLADASRWAASEKVALIDTHTELRDGKPEVEASSDRDKKPETPSGPFDLDKAILPERERPENTPGALLRVALDGEHWLSAGHDGEIAVMVDGRRVLTPIKLDKGDNVALYAAKDRLVASGLVWEEAQAQLARKAYLIEQPLGEGHIVAFAEDPNYRAYAEATELLFANAVLLGPAY